MEREAINPDELGRIAKEISGNAPYPINSFDELAKALGGDDATVYFDGERHIVGQRRNLLPTEAFPLYSEEDFIQKITALEARHRECSQEYYDQQQAQAFPEDTDPPSIPPDIEPPDLPVLIPLGPWC